MASPQELTEEEVFANDIDPIDALREIRKAEGVAEDDLPVREDISDAGDLLEKKEEEKQERDAEELDVFEDKKPPVDKKDASEEEEEENDDFDDDKGERDDLPEEEDEDDSSSKEKVKPSAEIQKFKANGQEFEFTQEEINQQFQGVFAKAMNFTQKMQQIAPYRKMISAIEQEGLTEGHLNIAIDALKGDKGAIRELLKAHKIEADDLDPDFDEDNPAEPYRPKEYGSSESELAIQEVTSTIEADPEYKITVDVIDKQWDSTSRKEFMSNPRMILGLHNDIKTGKFDQVAPRAMKMKVLDGNTRSDLEYYMLAGEQIRTQEQSSKAEQTASQLNKQTQDEDDKFEEASSEAKRKRSASSTGKRGDRSGVIDYLDDDDEKFETWYNNLMSNS